MRQAASILMSPWVETTFPKYRVFPNPSMFCTFKQICRARCPIRQRVLILLVFIFPLYDVFPISWYGIRWKIYLPHQRNSGNVFVTTYNMQLLNLLLIAMVDLIRCQSVEISLILQQESVPRVCQQLWRWRGSESRKTPQNFHRCCCYDHQDHAALSDIGPMFCKAHPDLQITHNDQNVSLKKLFLIASSCL